ncbi:MAG: hypothetical protein IJM90_01990 [Firmicutes bacterium]|nr:hypothetical protein [Bacillota bacterium]
MAQILEYKCPCCGGAIAFDSSLQKMKCPFCDTEFEMEALQSFDESLQSEIPDQINWDMNAGEAWDPAETAGLRSYVCKSCGGEIVGDETLAATSCPFCGNPVVMMEQFSGGLKPDYVIPFKLDKKAAKEALTNHLKDKSFLPRIFKSQQHIDEIKGVYVPFWLFDADADVYVRYRGEKVLTYRQGQYDHIDTSIYQIIRSGRVAFQQVPVDASTKIPDDLMESLEPYDFSEAVPFQTAYLAGYLADRYDITAEDSVERANHRVKTSAEEVMRDSVVGYSGVEAQSSNVQIENGRVRYALYPVWLLNTSWEGKQYTFAMNGQTGKFVGDLPADNKAYWKTFALMTAGIGAVVYLIRWLFSLL